MNLLTRMFTPPSQCVICAAWPAQTFCDLCVRSFARPAARCHTCAISVPDGVPQCGACVRNPPLLGACHVAISYEAPWDRCIRDFKFHAQPGLAWPLALLMRSAPWIEPELDTADWLIPMPLAIGRLRERGYNQAALLARALDGSKCRTDLLQRIRETSPQSSQDRATRLTALRGAFAANPRQLPSLRGATVVLVDDVITTGASLHAAATALLDAGVLRVTAIAVARTP
jgi:ComF family protein